MFIATAMALENKQAGENFTSLDNTNAKTIESISSDSYAEEDGINAEGYLLQENPDRWRSMFSALQPYSGNKS